MSTRKETILVVGATGHIGISAILGARRAGYNVLAIVRNQTSADKLFHHVGSKDGITTVEADISKEDGVLNVVERVRNGDLPGFQHVYAAAGGAYPGTLLKDMTLTEMRKVMHVDFELNFLAYIATVPYLLEKNHPTSTWTLCTGASGTTGTRAGPGITQGALFSLAAAAAVENKNTNIRFNEQYLSFRVEVDENAAMPENSWMVGASRFSKVYEKILNDTRIKGKRVIADVPEDCDGELRVQDKFVAPNADVVVKMKSMDIRTDL